MSSFSIVHSIIKFTLCIGVAGGLVDLTIAMGRKAGEAKKMGMISYKKLNRTLQGGR